ncbi:peptide ABC transporter substrate-binding protein [Paenibacillus thermoaerophilus]|uniref:Peptide ABC transporter substrate-binding protein n=1 Tax=Paenibacillus thermoaerophilus TaxID=1215385 RepID=A0ABW2UXN4_9BACL|nr:peptide ABC transporter substrate-binding protein [Paenibacillus thermoaerophilus]TMV19063.1 peptide ABC transporter substrate-binding protein [Paenibacillus thermoaerophilus]
MKAKKWLSAGLAMAVLGTAVVGCSSDDEGTKSEGGAGSAAPAAKQEINVNFAAEPPALDSSKGTTNAAFTMLHAMHEGLVRLDKDGKATPGLAKELPKVSEDGLTYTFTLRDNLKWADGSPLTANDFVEAYRRTLDPETKALYGFMVAWIKGGNDLLAAKTPEEVKAKKEALGVKAIDDKTLEIKLERPVPFFTELLAFPIFYPQNQKMVQQAGEKYGADADKIIGAGPYKLTEWLHEQRLVFTKNENYWDAANVKLEKITVNIVKDPQTGLNLFESGQADWTYLRGDSVQLYEGKPEYTPKRELVNAYVMLQQDKFPAFKNAKIRQALSMAINSKALVDTVLKNGSVPSTGFIPNGTSDGNGGDFRKVAGDTQPKFDVEKAKALLAEGLAELNLTALPKFKLMADDTDAGKKTLEFVLAQWKQNLGVEAEAEPVPHELRVDRQNKGDYQAVMALWGADYNDPMTFLDLWLSDAALNSTGWKNAQYDALVKGAQVQTDRAKRSADLVAAEKLLMQEMPILPIYFRQSIFAKNTKLENVVLPSYGAEWDFRWAYVKG